MNVEDPTQTGLKPGQPDPLKAVSLVFESHPRTSPLELHASAKASSGEATRGRVMSPTTAMHRARRDSFPRSRQRKKKEVLNGSGNENDKSCSSLRRTAGASGTSSPSTKHQIRQPCHEGGIGSYGD